ncbi:hypothetical protein ID0007_11900 [Helicobacter pylori]
MLSATDYYSWIDKDDYASFAWKMHRLINEDKLKENYLSADNANKIKQFFLFETKMACNRIDNLKLIARNETIKAVVLQGKKGVII